ncbi:MAG: helix-turn-helix domain-containing protein [Proteobacteria bacterium]|nr:helix-turn-helix domain-containing protein [Pseudomonadota bacterium]MBU1739891.1 helix-turn-helix domain-containing protein [Pseudomonadota bacterium]MBU1858221.1 helix-turn-helix domain-containing protein [Verrucomicrobiota bacterium]
MQNYTRTIITSALKLDGNYSPEQICTALKLIDGHKPDDRNPPLLLKQAEVARLLSVSGMSVWRLVREGVLPKVMIKGSPRYRRSDIVNLIAKGT